VLVTAAAPAAARRHVARSGEVVHHTALRIDLVGPEALAGQQAVAHRIAEGVHVTRGFPDGGVHEDASIQAHHVFTVTGHGAPPGVTQIPLQFGTHRAVVPDATTAAVDLATLVDETPALAEGYDLLHLSYGIDFGGVC
jgi:hypothetical protein